MHRLVLVAVALFELFFAGIAWSQAYPGRPIRFVVGFAPGGSADVIARVITAQLQRQLGVTVVVDNRPGAGGVIGYELVAKAEPDGYTLLCISTSFVTGIATYPKLPFDYRRDFTPITLFTTGPPNLVVVSAAFPGNSIRELIALSKNKDRPLTYGSPGIGSVQHFVAELFKLNAGIDLTHIPYKGQAPALTALLGGETQVVFLQPPGGVEFIKSGKLKALAFAGSSRWPGLPSVPTVAESGVPEFQLKGPFEGVLGPAKMPKEIVVKIHAEMLKVVDAPQVRDFFVASGWQADRRGPEEFRAFLNDEVRKYAQIARVAKIRPE